MHSVAQTEYVSSGIVVGNGIIDPPLGDAQDLQRKFVVHAHHLLASSCPLFLRRLIWASVMLGEKAYKPPSELFH
jgi:hypothetical protein